MLEGRISSVAVSDVLTNRTQQPSNFLARQLLLGLVQVDNVVNANIRNSMNSSPIIQFSHFSMTTPVTCTFPDSDTHTVEYPSDAQLTVLAIRNKLVSLTPYDAEAIQLFSTEGEGRELTNDKEVIPPGSELQATIHDDQAERKTALRDALANKDHANCWARVIICKDKTPLLRDNLSIGGAMMRLTAVNGEFFSFIGFEKFRDKRHRFGIPDKFLATQIRI